MGRERQIAVPEPARQVAAELSGLFGAIVGAVVFGVCGTGIACMVQAFAGFPSEFLGVGTVVGVGFGTACGTIYGERVSLMLTCKDAPHHPCHLDLSRTATRIELPTPSGGDLTRPDDGLAERRL